MDPGGFRAAGLTLSSCDLPVPHLLCSQPVSMATSTGLRMERSVHQAAWAQCRSSPPAGRAGSGTPGIPIPAKMSWLATEMPKGLSAPGTGSKLRAEPSRGDPAQGRNRAAARTKERPNPAPGGGSQLGMGMVLSSAVSARGEREKMLWGSSGGVQSSGSPWESSASVQ